MLKSAKKWLKTVDLQYLEAAEEAVAEVLKEDVLKGVVNPRTNKKSKPKLKRRIFWFLLLLYPAIVWIFASPPPSVTFEKTFAKITDFKLYGDNDSCYTRYVYKVEGEEYSAETTEDWKHCNKDLDKETEIYYNPENPEDYRFYPYEKGSPFPLAKILGVIMISIPTICLLSTLGQLRYAKKLTKQGITTGEHDALVKNLKEEFLNSLFTPKTKSIKMMKDG